MSTVGVKVGKGQLTLQYEVAIGDDAQATEDDEVLGGRGFDLVGEDGGSGDDKGGQRNKALRRA